MEPAEYLVNPFVVFLKYPIRRMLWGGPRDLWKNYHILPGADGGGWEKHYFVKPHATINQIQISSSNIFQFKHVLVYVHTQSVLSYWMPNLATADWSELKTGWAHSLVTQEPICTKVSIHSELKRGRDIKDAFLIGCNKCNYNLCNTKKPEQWI